MAGRMAMALASSALRAPLTRVVAWIVLLSGYGAAA
jgi:hypothetical protein